MIRAIIAPLLALPVQAAVFAQRPQPERHFIATQFVTTRRLAAPGLGQPLGRPALFAADRDRIYLFDFRDKKIKALTRDGTIAWELGAPGGGRFVNPTDVKLGPDGNIWVADAPQRALFRVSPDGQFLRRLTVSRSIVRIVPLAAGHFVGFDPQAEQVAGYEFDSLGQIVRRMALAKSLDTVKYLARTSIVGSSPTGRLFSAFTYGGMFARYDSASGQQLVFPAVEALPFPEVLEWNTNEGATITRVSPSAVHASISISVDRSAMYVLFGGTSPEKGRIVDTYAVSDGRYLGSYMLPTTAAAVIRLADGFLVAFSGPQPELVIGDWKRDHKGDK